MSGLLGSSTSSAERLQRELQDSVWIYNNMATSTPLATGITTSITDGGILVSGDVEIRPMAQAAPAPEATKPVGTVPTAPAKPDKEWLRLMKQLKLKVTKTVHRPLASFLQREEIVCYDYMQAWNWLKKVANEKNAQDPEWSMRGKPYRPMIGQLLFEGQSERGDESTNPHYTDPIPKEVLAIAARVRAEFPDANLSVMYVRAGDPFLIATVNDETHVVAMWDEPGFSIVK